MAADRTDWRQVVKRAIDAGGHIEPTELGDDEMSVRNSRMECHFSEASKYTELKFAVYRYIC